MPSLGKHGLAIGRFRAAETRHGLVVDVELTEATSRAEHEAALQIPQLASALLVEQQARDAYHDIALFRGRISLEDGDALASVVRVEPAGP